MGKQPESGVKTLKEIGGFEILAKVGQGGMGAVFKARQKSLDRVVALKVLPPRIAQDKDFIARFVREARASARLNHPNVVTGIDVGQDAATGLWYFAMEFVDGVTCGQMLRQKNRLPEDQALKIARDVAAALECAHQNGMVHRDVKPDNILFDQAGNAKLADLGLARHQDDDAGLTQAGTALGTPFYMAPEQVRGQVDTLDTRADLYALGATLFHLVTGQTPFQGETSAVIMAKHLSDPPPMANSICSDISAGCSKLILKLMQKDKAQRIQTPREVVEQIDRLLKLPPAARSLTTGPRVPIRGATTTAARDLIRPRPSKAPTPAAKSPVALYAGAGAGGVALLVLLGFLLFPSPRHPKVTPQAKKPPEAVATPASFPADRTGPAKPQTSPVEQRWQEVKAYAAAKPDAHGEILRQYQELLKAAAGSPREGEIETELLDVEARYDTAAQAAWQAVELKIVECVNTGDYDAALAAAQALPPDFAKRLRERVDEKNAALAKEAQNRIAPVLEEAEAASTALDPQSGLVALKTIESLKFGPLSEKTAALKARLEREQANVGELRARKKLVDLLARFDTALLKTGNTAEAIRVAREANGAPELDPVRDQADAMAAIMEADATETKRQEEALTALKGKPFVLGSVEGTIESIADDILSIQISMEGGKVLATKTFKISELPQAQKDQLFPPRKEASPAVRVREALRKLVVGKEDLEAATDALNAAPDFPLTPHYLKVIEGRHASVAESAAERAWPEVEAAAARPLISPEQAGPVFEKLQSFRQRFGGTAFAKTKAQEITAIETKLGAIACPNLVANGNFESGNLNGWKLLDASRRSHVSAAATAEAAHTGKFGLHFTASGYANYALTLVPGQTYRVSCWVKSVDAYIRVSLDQLFRNEETTRAGAATAFSEWQPLSFTFTATRPDHFISLLAYSKGACQAYYDDIEVVRAFGVEVAAVSRSSPTPVEAETTTVTGDPTTAPPTSAPPTTAQAATAPTATAPAATEATVRFIAEDTTSQGNWKKSYGKDGYIIYGGEVKPPAYAKFSCSGRPHVWEESTKDIRALERATGADRVAGCSWSPPKRPLNCDLELTDGKEHSVAFYFLDWKEQGTSNRVDVFDVASGKALDTQTAGNYGKGKYLVWRIKGSVQFRFRGRSEVMLSGVFFQ